MSETSPVSLICCDVVGAVAADGSIMERAFAEAIATQGVVVGTAAYVRSMVQFDRTRGWPPSVVAKNPNPASRIISMASSFVNLSIIFPYLVDIKTGIYQLILM